MIKLVGFTILEILVVILILGLTVSTIMITVPSSKSESDKLEELCLKYARTFSFVLEQSMVESKVLGLFINKDEMVFMTRVEPENLNQEFDNVDLITQIIKEIDNYENYEWSQYNIDQINTRYKWPKDLKVELLVGGISYQYDSYSNESFKKASLSKKLDEYTVPQIFFYPSMEVTPFSLTIKKNDVEEKFIIKVEENGHISVKQGKNVEENI